MRVRLCMCSLTMRVRSLTSDHSMSCIQHYLNYFQQYYLSYCSRAAHFDLLMAAVLKSAVARA